jgi:hypothetical protein
MYEIGYFQGEPVKQDLYAAPAPFVLVLLRSPVST